MTNGMSHAREWGQKNGSLPRVHPSSSLVLYLRPLLKTGRITFETFSNGAGRLKVESGLVWKICGGFPGDTCKLLMTEVKPLPFHHCYRVFSTRNKCPAETFDGKSLPRVSSALRTALINNILKPCHSNTGALRCLIVGFIGVIGQFNSLICAQQCNVLRQLSVYIPFHEAQLPLKIEVLQRTCTRFRFDKLRRLLIRKSAFEALLFYASTAIRAWCSEATLNIALQKQAKKPFLLLILGTNDLKVTCELLVRTRSLSGHPSKQQPRSTLLDSRELETLQLACSVLQESEELSSRPFTRIHSREFYYDKDCATVAGTRIGTQTCPSVCLSAQFVTSYLPRLPSHLLAPVKSYFRRCG
ncbi:hypothetical protein J6590_023528 [Homalodisca vitripennis]|nr:hypothetical protein J6590_023528 [Homalodisca vitripennis]